jgi:hypothetical protein
MKFKEYLQMENVNIKELAPTFVENYTDENVPKSVYENYTKKIEKYKEYIGTGSKYFFGHLHDSDILVCKNDNGNLYLKVNEMATFEFACALIDKMKLKINKQKIIFPLEIISEHTNHLSLNIVDIDGKIYENKFVKLNEYLYEEIIEWNNENIKIAFDLWSHKLKQNRHLLILSCEKLIISEKQSIYWKKYFGEEYNKYYDIFLEKRNKGEYLSDYSLCEKLIDKINEE